MSENEEDILDDLKPPSGPGSTHVDHAEGDISQSSIFVQWIIAFISYLRNIYKISDIVTGKLLKFLCVLFGLLGQFSNVCKTLASLLPRSVYKLHQYTGSAGIRFKKYVACRSCHQLYDIGQCCGDENSRKCSHVHFPNHPHLRRRQPCGSYLVKTVELASGRKVYYPFLVYCYLDIETSLQSLLLHSKFYSHCREWKSRTHSGMLEDVYDGKVWNDFLVYDSKPFLADEYTFGFILNIDWFQPFKHISYSVGAIYLCVLNLPRHIRYKQEFVILVGIMPGPQEAKSINSYLEPLTEQLIEFWSGKHLSVYGSSVRKLVRCALLGVCCDLPAGRKACGFLSYNAHFGCSRCLKPFEGIVGSLNFSGFDRNSWPNRNTNDHRAAASRIRIATTQAEVTRIESETGYRNTVLLRLPYFSPTRMLVIDIMHNLFLGTGKRVIRDIWIGLQLISESQFDIIQARMDCMVIPTGIGRIPYKIRSGFSSFTADQLKNWINLFSLLTLRDILTGEDLEIWRHYVLACRILSSKRVASNDITVADALLMRFCQRVEQLYGQDLVTPNMHMHAHLKECVIDYGPPHAFWAFAFERYNGILGEQPNNNRSIELQLAKRFVYDNRQSLNPLPEMYNDQFSPTLESSRHVVGTLLEFSPFVSIPTHSLTDWTINGVVAKVPSTFSRGVFSISQTNGLQQLYCSLHSVPSTSIMMASSFRKYKDVTLYGRQLGSKQSRSSSSSIVMANWNLTLSDESVRPARINYFAEHSVCINDTWMTHLLFSASWFKTHSKQQQYGKPISLWECDIFEIPGRYSILPVQAIKCRTISLEDKLESGESVLFVCPCIDF